MLLLANSKTGVIFYITLLTPPLSGVMFEVEKFFDERRILNEYYGYSRDSFSASL